MNCERIDSLIGDPWYYCPESPNPGCTETFEEKEVNWKEDRRWKLICNNKEVASYWYTINKRLEFESIISLKKDYDSDIYDTRGNYKAKLDHNSKGEDYWYFSTYDDTHGEGLSSDCNNPDNWVFDACVAVTHVF